MMDYYYGKRYFRIITIATLIAVCLCESADHDIILTPKESSQVKGKTLYYRPLEDLKSAPGIRVPWERVLKHLTYVTLHGMVYEKNQLSDDNVDYKKFMNASYIIQTDHIVTNFGDTITLAEGRVEKLPNNKYSFVEDKCTLDNKKCNGKNVIAQWQVQKIRHCDAAKKFRNEIKFSIDPYYAETSTEGLEAREMENNKRVTRSFILRDFDYPSSFIWFDQQVSQRRIDENQRYLDRLHHFNEVFMQPFYIDSSYYTSDNPSVANLNLGEFLHQPIQRRVPDFPRYITPTTYRPKYHVKFSKPPLSYEIPVEKNILPFKAATHLHHHYYVAENKYDEAPRPYNRQNLVNYDINPSVRPTFAYFFPTPSPIKHQIPTPPNFFNHLAQTPVPLQLTSPLIPPPPSQQNIPQYSTAAPNRPIVHDLAQKVFYNVPQNFGASQYQLTQQTAQTVQPLLYNFQFTRPPIINQQEYFQQVTPTQPFVESPKEEKVRYSEPDPLYTIENPIEQQIIVKAEHIVSKQADRPSEVVRFEEPSRQQSDFESQWSRPEEQNIESDAVDPPSVSNPHTFSSEIDVDRSVENPSALDTNTERNQITEDDNTNNNLQMHAPQIDSYEESTTLPVEPPNDTVSNESMEAMKLHQHLPETSLDTPKHETALNSVEVTHLGAPVDPPEVKENFISTTSVEPSASSTTTQRSVNAYEGVPTSSFPKTNLIENQDDPHVSKAEVHYKSTSERPVLKWKPKRPRIKPASKTNSQSDTTYIIAKTRRVYRPIKTASNDSSVSIERVPDEDTIQKIFRYNPTTESGKRTNNTNVSTKRSYSTSVSVKVGTSKEVPYQPSLSIPNVELFKAQLESLNTNSSLIKFFKASDKNEKPGGEDEVERMITSSIVKHATSLDT